MAKRLFNEAEEVLLRNWGVVEELNNTQDEILPKYENLCQQVINSVRENHKELDYLENRVNVTTGAQGRQATLIIASKQWPADGANWPTGFWGERFSLASLADIEAASPVVWLWIARSDVDGRKIDVKAAISQIRADSKSLLAQDELKTIRLEPQWEDEYDDVIGFQLDRQDLMQKLLEGDGSQFVATVSEKFEVLAKFIPTLNKIFARP
jgi:hypothetical protein